MGVSVVPFWVSDDNGELWRLRKVIKRLYDYTETLAFHLGFAFHFFVQRFTEFGYRLASCNNVEDIPKSS